MLDEIERVVTQQLIASDTIDSRAADFGCALDEHDIKQDNLPYSIF